MCKFYILKEEKREIKNGASKVTYDTRYPIASSSDLDIAIELFEKFVNKGRRVILVTPSMFKSARKIFLTDQYYSGVEILRSTSKYNGKLISSKHTSDFVCKSKKDNLYVKSFDYEDVYAGKVEVQALVEHNRTTGIDTFHQRLPLNKIKMKKGQFTVWFCGEV